jgi:hypothetical protein
VLQVDAAPDIGLTERRQVRVQTRPVERIGGAAFALLMVVMRGLLRSATMLRRELEEVV